jgi:rhodanese-related sulfurtransferase
VSDPFAELRALFAPPALAPEAFLAERGPADLVLDVRTPAEYAAGHLVGAVNVDVSAPDFRQRAAALDLSQRLFVYCLSGSRSAQAVGLLRSLGAARVDNLGALAPLVHAGAPAEASPLP